MSSDADSQPVADYDSPWKEALEHYFQPFMALLWPELHERIDWSQPPHFLDKELQKIVRDANSGRRYADKLVQVATHEHGTRLILVYVEIQGRSDPGFAARMHRYYYRLRDAYADAVIENLAVLTQRRRGPPIIIYRDAGLSSVMEFSFPVVHLAKWLDHWRELETTAASNPFAVVVMAQLLAHYDVVQMRTQPLDEAANGIQDCPGEVIPTRKDERKLRAKIWLTRMLYQYGHSRQDVLELYRLIDWMITLPPALEARFVQAGERIEKEHEMPFVLTAERVGERRGRQEGRLEGQSALLRRQLTRKFGPLPEWAEARITQASNVELMEWADRVLDAAKLDDVMGRAI